MMPSSDSVSTITIESSSSRCRERKQFEQQLSELRSENASLSNTVKRLQNDLRVKEDEILEMQEVHEHQMLGMLKTKLSNTNVSVTTFTSVSCHRQNDDSSSHQTEVPKPKGSKIEANGVKAKTAGWLGPQSKSCSWCKIKSEMSYCGRSVLGKIKIRPSMRSIPKVVVVSLPIKSEESNLTY